MRVFEESYSPSQQPSNILQFSERVDKNCGRARSTVARGDVENNLLVGALAFKRTGMGAFTVPRTFGLLTKNLDEL